MYEKVPGEMKQYSNWVCFRYEEDPKHPEKPKKVPINPRTGGYAMSNNPDTWSDFNTALNALASGRYSGLGFMFSQSPFFGVDLDHKQGEIEDFVRGAENIISEFLNALQSYTELSPSGTGIHVICRGELPPGRRKNGDFEMYDSGRFFTVTGNQFGAYTGITDCTERIKPLHKKYLETENAANMQREILRTPVQVGMPGSAAEIIELASRAKNGAKFVALYNGDISGYPSQSEADLALCNMLAFWTRRDAELMDALFRQSGLYRTEKWDRKQSGTTYGAITLQKAIAECQNVYEPSRSESSGYRVKIGGSGNGGENEEVHLYTTDDMGNAQRFIYLFGDVVRYNFIAKKWIYWDGKNWRYDEDGAIERMADRAVEAMRAEAKIYEQEGDEEALKAFRKHIKSSRSNKSKGNLIRESQHLLPIMPSALDKHPFAFNTPSGIISLRTGDIVPHDKQYMITKIAGVEIADAADCPIWLALLDTVFGSDADLIRYFQKAVGYSLTGSIVEQCIFILFGTGHNGKSTVLETIRDIVGEYSANIQAETIMVKRGGGGISSDIARLNKYRFVTSSEPNEGDRLNEGLIKQLTGGEPVTARRLFENEMEFHPELKLWIGTNHKIIVRGTDPGIWRRLHIIPFNVEIPPEKTDKNIKEKLKKEYPAILRWMVDGALLWQREGLEKPRAVYERSNEYRREMDVVSAFIDDMCEEREGAYVRASELYASYSAWCTSNGEYQMSNTSFGTEIGKRFKKVKRSDGAFYIGIEITR